MRACMHAAGLHALIHRKCVCAHTRILTHSHDVMQVRSLLGLAEPVDKGIPQSLADRQAAAAGQDAGKTAAVAR